jgi:phosphopantetheinyl transferase
MTEYFRAMENFLETQERIMQAYLGSGDFTAAEDSRHQVADMPVPPQAHRGRILDAAKDSEAVISETQDRQVTPAAAAEIASPPAGGNTTESDARIMLTGENLAQFFLACISDKTGYPLEMLSLDQDLEADLGIDSIKRLEILGGIIQHIGSLDSGAMEQLTSLKTTGEIVAVLAQELDRAASRAASGMTGEQFQDLPEAPPDPRPAIGEYPFLLFHGKVTQIIPGEKVVVERRLDLKEDLFLQHHTLGGKVSQSDADLLALPLVPFSVSLEMMAETAAHLFPGKLLVAMSVIKTHNWIAVEDQQLTLEIVAEARPGKPEEIGVQLKIVQNEGAQKAPAQLAVEGTMIFGDAYPTAPPAGAFHPGVKSPPCLSPDQFYPCALFHGPLFQSVSRLQSCGDKGAEAVLQVPPNHQILRGVSNPPFLTDPVLLDGAGQVVGLWAASNLDKNFVIFPVGLEEVRFYSPSPETSLPAICRVLSALQESANICSDIELLREDGAVVAQLKGLQHKRAQLAPIIHEFRGSREVMLSTPWQAPLAPLTSADTVSCCRLAGNNLNFEGADGRIWRNVVAYIVLNRRERETWARLSGPERRRTEWLLARVAGKEAVRRLLKMRHGVAVWSADIEIQADEHGKPLVLGDWVNRTGKAPSLSLSHSRGTAAALAAESANGLQVGIDLEALAPPKTGYERLAFDSEEFALLSQLGLAESAEWRLRLWCAKEAAAKALGRGLLGGPRNLIARHMDKESGRVSLAISGSLLREFPHFAGRTLEAYTLVQNEFIFATAFCHKGD